MNNIQEKDWAEESWGGFSGMDKYSDYCIVEKSDDTKAVKERDGNEIVTKETPL